MKRQRCDEEKKKKANRTNNLLSEVKTWKGPITTTDELKAIIKMKDKGKQKKILKTEVSLRKLLHPDDAVNRKSLYLVNKLTNEQLIANFKTILEYGDQDYIELDEDEMIVRLNELFN